MKFSIDMENINSIMKNKLLLAASLIFIIALNSCSKNDKQDYTKLEVRLTDAPIDLDSVFVDIQQVRVKTGNNPADSLSEAGWVDLQTTTGIYDLLSYQNGIDTLLASGTIPMGYVKEIRFIMGPNNRVVDSFGVTKPLTIPSGSESGLKIKVSKQLNATLNTIIIDFDAALSIKKENDGYKLRPVLKVK